jgi:nucleoside 2-deoxyribosyltransferase
MQEITLYLAAGLFNAAERLHVLYLEKHLLALGHKAIVPQREALKFFKDGLFNVRSIVADCTATCKRSDVICIVSLDGTDADSGSAVEFTVGVLTNGHAIVYRTDFRTALEKELGVNAMFTMDGTAFLYKPCFFTELSQVDTYYAQLAKHIDEEVRMILAKNK